MAKKVKVKKAPNHIDKVSAIVEKLSTEIPVCLFSIQEIQDPEEQAHYHKEFYKMVHAKIKSLAGVLDSLVEKDDK